MLTESHTIESHGDSHMHMLILTGMLVFRFLSAKKMPKTFIFDQCISLNPYFPYRQRHEISIEE